MRVMNSSNRRLGSLGVWSPMALLVVGACATANTPTESTTPPGSTGADDAGSSGSESGSSGGSGSPTSTSGNVAASGSLTGSSGAMSTSGGSGATTGQLSGSGSSSGTTTSDAGPVSAGDGGGGPAQKSAGCGMAKPTLETSIKVGSSTGNITVDVPTNYDSNKAYPLIMVWHGAGVTGTAFHGYLDMHTAAGNDAIVVTPECLDGGSTWPTDASYPDAIMAHFESAYCIDKSRIFTTGHSMGGLYTGTIGCLRGDVLRGDAVLAAPHPAGACKKGTMAVMMEVGMSDPTGTMPTTEFPWWAMENGCSTMSTPVDPMSFYTKALDESGTCVDYVGCGALTPFRGCTFMGGHEIPPWVAAAIWNFFKKL